MEVRLAANGIHRNAIMDFRKDWKMKKTSSALDRLEKALAAEGVTLPRHRLKHIAATVAGCRNDNEFVSRSADLYPPAARIAEISLHDLHVLRDERTQRIFAVDSQSLAPGQRRDALLMPSPYGGMLDVEDAILPASRSDTPVGTTKPENSGLPLFRFTITRDTTESAEVEVHANSIEEAHDLALDRNFWSNSRNATFELDEGNWAQRPYLPDPDDYEIVE